MSGPRKQIPDRAAVARIVAEEAERHGADLSDVLGASNRLKAKAARTQAIARIIHETGCSHGGLEVAWGSSLRKLPRRNVVRGPDAATMERLVWQYGPEKAAKIVAGQNRKTQADLAAWRRLGTGRAAA